MHSILYLNFYKEDTSQFYFVKSKRDRESQSNMIVTLTSWVPKIMTSDQGNMQHSEMPKFAFQKNFPRVYFLDKVCMWSIALLHLRDGEEDIIHAFWRWTLLQKVFRMKPGHPSLLYALCSMPCAAKIRGTSLPSQTCSFFICYPVNIRLIIPHNSQRRGTSTI